MVSFVPAGWPAAVQPPESDGFQPSAVAWLLDVLPPGYRGQRRVQRYPIGLAVIARHHTQACVEGTRQGYRAIRSELSRCLPSEDIDAVLVIYATEGKRQVVTARSVALVEEALFEDGFRPL
ncbi:MAG TPA: hypothetical protein VMU95_28470 [Trebonia sp.]|nr:hypothetical protein [Trebonia sp.]